MTSRNDDERRGRRTGTEGFGHDPRRGASSPQWNREAQMQQFQERRHGSPYDSPYGGQYGGYEDSPEPHQAPARRFRDEGEGDDAWRDEHRRYGPSNFGGAVGGDFESYGAYMRGRGEGRRRYDPDYEQWRHEQVQRLDEDYEAYRRERYSKFSEDFDAWRAGRAQRNASAPQGGGSNEGKGGGNKQQG